MTATKQCRVCEIQKNEGDFYKHYAQCKPCYNKKRSAYYFANRARLIPEHRAYYNSTKHRFKHLNRENNLKQYGLTVELYDVMLETQGGKCALCLGINADGRRLAVDHDHATGTVRGLLCGECNQSLGKMMDSPELLRKAAEYIEKMGKL